MQSAKSRLKSSAAFDQFPPINFRDRKRIYRLRAWKIHQPSNNYNVWAYLDPELNKFSFRVMSQSRKSGHRLDI